MCRERAAAPVKIEVSQQCSCAEETCSHCPHQRQKTTFGTKTRQAAAGRSLKSVVEQWSGRMQQAAFGKACSLHIVRNELST